MRQRVKQKASDNGSAACQSTTRGPVVRSKDRKERRARRKACLVNLGLHIRALREAAGLSTGALARRCGVYADFLADVEAGLEEPALITLYRIGEALDLTLAEVLDFPE
jgi:ribosome-binding protein aMBF1 (putative translation factor)